LEDLELGALHVELQAVGPEVLVTTRRVERYRLDAPLPLDPEQLGGERERP
jgi:hypothetical protein